MNTPNQLPTTTFQFGKFPLNAVTDEAGVPWFNAFEVCAALEHTDTSKAVSRLDDDEKLIRTMFVSGQNREILTINESGLYSLIMTSRKAEAKNFKKWVTSEVLPSIRKTGTFALDQTMPKPAQPVGIGFVDPNKAVFFGKSHDATTAGIYYAAIEARVMGVEHAAEKYGLSIQFVQSLSRFKAEHLKAWDPKTRDGSSFLPF